MQSILRLSKKFLLLILMIVLPINSFAAVSVSDGSAFVSKSEFSSTINNISNRMSTIENTLDAKIDSLVSSYLSRNGIWNGDKQTVNLNTAQNSLTYFYAVSGFGATNKLMSNVSGASSFSYYLSLPHQVSNSSAIAASAVYNIDYYGNNTYTIISNITKSGLMCVNYQYKSQTGTPYIAGSRYRLPTDSVGRTGFVSNLYNYGWSLPINWNFYESNLSGTRIGQILYSLSQEFNNTTISPWEAQAKIIFNDSSSSFYSFVSKGNQLRLECIIGGNGFQPQYIRDGFWGACFVATTAYNAAFNECMGLCTSVAISDITIY